LFFRGRTRKKLGAVSLGTVPILLSFAILPYIATLNQEDCADIPQLVGVEENTHQSFTVSSYSPSPINQVLDRDQVVYSLEMIWPVDYPQVSSHYGHRTPSCKVCSSQHNGVDFTPGEGSPIYAVIDGTVVEVATANSFGHYVVLEHTVLLGSNMEGQKWRTTYAHLKEVPYWLQVGDTVVLGETIGHVGRTGVATGPHLHFEISIDGKTVNPFPILKKYARYFPDYQLASTSTEDIF
jgi:murein DD-endopeptidase MepM/ murein hydrolase activator NlpD